MARELAQFIDGRDRAEEAVQRIDEWVRHLSRLASDSIPEIEETSFLGRELRAGAAISAMAEIEALLREMLVGIGDHISHSYVPVRDLVPSLRPLVMHTSFESLISTRQNEKMWEHRLTVTRLENSMDMALFPKQSTKTPQPPLDGRTIQPHHIALVWRVLGLEKSTPPASTMNALKKLTQIRNDVAHRNISVQEIFAQAGNTAREIARYLDSVSTLLIHIGVEWYEYLKHEKYLVRKNFYSLQPGNR